MALSQNGGQFAGNGGGVAAAVVAAIVGWDFADAFQVGAHR
jgi:hypothetical protein